MVGHRRLSTVIPVDSWLYGPKIDRKPRSPQVPVDSWLYGPKIDRNCWSVRMGSR